jgi:hypothetical protein
MDGSASTWHCVWWCDTVYDDVTLCMIRRWMGLQVLDIVYDDVTLFMMMWHCVWSGDGWVCKYFCNSFSVRRPKEKLLRLCWWYFRLRSCVHVCVCACVRACFAHPHTQIPIVASGLRLFTFFLDKTILLKDTCDVLEESYVCTCVTCSRRALAPRARHTCLSS